MQLEAPPALELVSPRNKDRQSARATYLARYLTYLHQGANLLLVDVHPRPLPFSFPDALAEQLQIHQPACAAPCSVAYRVGEPAAQGGRMLAIWRRSLHVGEPLPLIPLPFTVSLAIPVDLHPAAKGSGLFSRNGPEGASQKRGLTPFPASFMVAYASPAFFPLSVPRLCHPCSFFALLIARMARPGHG